MKKLYISITSLLSVAGIAQSQTVAWQKELGGVGQNFLTGMNYTLDRQILVSGSAVNSEGSSSNGFDYHAVKLSQDGKIVWDKYFGGSGHDFLVSALPTQEGGFLLSGTSSSGAGVDKGEDGFGGTDIWLVRLSENGQVLWDRTIGTESDEEASEVVQTKDKGFLISGNITSQGRLYGSKDLLISKLDKDGNLLRTTILGGGGFEEVKHMVATEDGGALVLAYSRSGNTPSLDVDILKAERTEKSKASLKKADVLNKGGIATQDFLLSVHHTAAKNEAAFGEGDYWIIKLDKNGIVSWQKTYGGKEDDSPRNITLMENGYLIGGESRSSNSGNKKESLKEGTDIWLIALDLSGNEVWQKSYSFGNRDVLMSVDAILETDKDNRTRDKGFLLGGFTQPDGVRKDKEETFWLLYINSEGREVWRKYVEGESRKKNERLVSARMMGDGSYLLAGMSSEVFGEEKWKVLKLGDKELDALIQKHDIRIYPNPVDSYCYVEIGLPLDINTGADLYLHDMSGRQLKSLNTKQAITKIDTSTLPQGVYIITAKTKTKTVNTKIIKK